MTKVAAPFPAPAGWTWIFVAEFRHWIGFGRSKTCSHYSISLGGSVFLMCLTTLRIVFSAFSLPSGSRQPRV